MAVVTVGCKKSATPAWGDSETVTTTVTNPTTAATPQPKSTKKTAKPAAVSDQSAAPGGLRFISYNVENWLTMDRYVGGKKLKDSPKPEDEKLAVIRILARHAPDVIGLSEIGTATDLADIQTRLKTAGFDLAHSYHTGGSDPTRHLGILSRFPILANVVPTEMEYQLLGRTHSINRGILDSTIGAHGKSYRFIGVHLKSKRDSEQGDQEAIRLNEARLLRRHVDTILKDEKDARLIVYGDFNDTRATPVIKTITGKYNHPSYLTAIPAKDSAGHSWTHFWALRDVYSRFDFVMVSRGIRAETDFSGSKIIDDAEWNDGSDHRAVVAIFK